MTEQQSVIPNYEIKQSVHMEYIRETIHDYSNKVVERSDVKATFNSRINNELDIERD